MPTKKIVTLFGAGAVLDWGAPKTICERNELAFIPEHGSGEIKNRVCCLTHLVTATGFKDRHGERITNKILKSLSTRNKQNINFETIINILEDLYAYWAIKQSPESKSLFSIASLDTSIQDLSFFQHGQVNRLTHQYSISIPGFDLLKDDYVSVKIHPYQKYYEMFLDELLGGIIGHVSKYSYHTSDYNVIFKEYNKSLNDNFCKWIRSFTQNDYSVRMYTLNYDRMFKVLLQNQGTEVFEGFDVPNLHIAPGDMIPPNIPKIISDQTSNVFYNLHGSAYWSIQNENNNNLPGYQYFLSGVPETNDRAAIIEIENGRRLLLTNIITGYQKVQKTAISPFRQMFSAFDKDCFEATELYIIGYSFGDEHINDIIRNARKYNNELEIVIISPTFDNEKFMFDFILHWGSLQGGIYKNNGRDEILSPNHKVRILKKRFGEFLTQQN